MPTAEFHLGNRNRLGKSMSLKAIVPDTGDGPFPVLYLLHGLSDDHNDWTRNTRLERFVADLPLIVIMPNGERGFYTNNVSRPYADFESYLAEDIVQFADRTFRTIASREGRVLAGFSMGGYGAIKFGLKYPELFSSVGSIAGATNFAHWAGTDEGRIREFGPALGENGIGGDNDVYTLAERLPIAQRPTIFITCGLDDFLLPANQDFHRHLIELSFDHRYEEHPGSHNWDYCDKHIQYILQYFAQQLGLPAFSPDSFKLP